MDITNPVIILKGANHMSFSSNPVPLFVKTFDLKSELDEKNAHYIIKNTINAFILNDSIYMKKQVLQSSVYFAPFVEAMLQEGSCFVNISFSAFIAKLF